MSRNAVPILVAVLVAIGMLIIHYGDGERERRLGHVEAHAEDASQHVSTGATGLSGGKRFDRFTFLNGSDHDVSVEVWIKQENPPGVGTLWHEQHYLFPSVPPGTFVAHVMNDASVGADEIRLIECRVMDPMGPGPGDDQTFDKQLNIMGETAFFRSATFTYGRSNGGNPEPEPEPTWGYALAGEGVAAVPDPPDPLDPLNQSSTNFVVEHK